MKEKLINYLRARCRILLVALPLACAILLVPSHHWLLELLRHFRLWCGAIALFLLVVSFGLKFSRRWKALALATAVWQLFPLLTWPLPNSNSHLAKTTPKASLTLVNFNLLYRCTDKPTAAQQLLALDADVYAFQEYSPEWQELLPTVLSAYPHRLEEPEEMSAGLALFSKWPLRNQRVVGDGGFDNALQAGIQLPHGTLGLLVVHPQPPSNAEGFAAWQATIQTWPQRLKSLTDEHLVITGDFNVTPFCRTYQQALKDTGLLDTSRGHTFQNTWYLGGVVPLGLPLDHVLASPNVVVPQREIGSNIGSDHRWIRVQLQLY